MLSIEQSRVSQDGGPRLSISGRPEIRKAGAPEEFHELALIVPVHMISWKGSLNLHRHLLGQDVQRIFLGVVREHSANVSVRVLWATCIWMTGHERGRESTEVPLLNALFIVRGPRKGKVPAVVRIIVQINVGTGNPEKPIRVQTSIDLRKHPSNVSISNVLNNMRRVDHCERVTPNRQRFV